MSEFFREVVNLSNQQELERNNAFDGRVNKYLPKVEAKIRKEIMRNTRYRKILVKEPHSTVKLEAIHRVCNKLKEEGFSVTEWTSPYEYKFFIIISW